MSQTKAQLVAPVGIVTASNFAVSDGTAGAPSIRFSDSSTTGIYSPGSNQFAITTNGVGRITIDASGNVVAGGTLTAGSFIPTSSSVPTNGLYLSAANTLALATNSVGRITVDASGNINIDSGGVFYDATNNRLGIGTSAPGTRLQIGDSTVNSSNVIKLGLRVTSGQTNLPLIGHTSDGTGSDLGLCATSTSGSIRFFTGNDAAGFGTGSNEERVRIDSSGRVGIGTTSPQHPLHIKNAGSSACRLILENNGSSSATSTQVWSQNNDLVFDTNGGEAVRIDSSRRLLVGTSSARTDFLNTTTFGSTVQIETATTSSRGLAITNNASTNSESILFLSKSNGSSNGSVTAVASGNRLGSIHFQGADGANLVAAATISAEVDGTPGANDMPVRLVFSVTQDGSASPTERLRVSNNGTIETFQNAYGYFGVKTAGTDAAAIAFMVANGASSTVTGTARMVVREDGDVENTNNSYGSLSDVKLKENIVDATSQWSDIKALQVRKYNFKEETGHSTHTQIGLVAQEVELVSPGLVSESPDRDEDGNDLGTVTKSINYSVLYMKAVKALQEAMERIETLEIEKELQQTVLDDLLARVVALT